MYLNEIQTRTRETRTPFWSQTWDGSSLASAWWPAWKSRKEDVEPPPCVLTTRRESHWGQMHCKLGGRHSRGTPRTPVPGIATGSRDIGRHLAGGEGAGADTGGVLILTRYVWGHLHAQHQFWNQTAGEGLDSLLFQSCPGCEVPGVCGDTHKSPAECSMLELSPVNERVVSMVHAASRWG